MDGQLLSIDLNEIPIDKENIMQLEENELLFNEHPKGTADFVHNLEDATFVECGQKINDSGVNEFDPFIGQCFFSEEEAFIFYKKYGFRNGFSIRKDRTIKKNGEVKRRDFCCQCEGKAPLKLVDPCKAQRNRQSVKCECKGRMRITLRKSFDIFPQEWQITEFVKEHNHELLAPSEVRFLSASRKINKEDECRILLLKEGGLSVRQIMRVMELEQDKTHGLLPFFEKDVRNLFTRVGKKHEINDATDILQYCELAKEENYKFRYAFTIDEQRKLKHIFWSSAHCFDWYERYGDVVVFDTTYKINTYQMPFGIFVGVNNHGKTVLFGCALLRNETVDVFQWLFKTFLSLMKKQPKTILTDQDPWMSEAIAKEFPSTKHSFCIWHITSKFSGWFTSVLRNQYQTWCANFYKLYHLETPQEFEVQWALMVAKYNLHCNKHIIGLYEIKYFWVPAYLRDYFFGGMTTTGRSESINAFIKRYINSHTNLEKFVKQVDLGIEDIQQKEFHDTMLQKYRGSSLRTMSPLEEQACGLLTPFCFKKFQEEFGRATLYSLLHEEGHEFIVKHHNHVDGNKHNIFWDSETASCSCKHFEFWGILCRHILSVFLHKDCYKIPSIYLPPRWCRDTFQHKEGPQMSDDESLRDKVIDDVYCPPISKTKGRPKTKRMKGGKEVARKQKKTCGLCKSVGHNIMTCPEKENFDCATYSQKKKKKISSSDIGLNPVLCLKY